MQPNGHDGRSLGEQIEAIADALDTGTLTAGRLLGLPDLGPEGMWCDIAGASAISGVLPSTITAWLTRGGPKRRPFPRPMRILYRLYWTVEEVTHWRDDSSGTLG